MKYFFLKILRKIDAKTYLVFVFYFGNPGYLNLQFIRNILTENPKLREWKVIKRKLRKLKFGNQTNFYQSKLVIEQKGFAEAVINKVHDKIDTSVIRLNVPDRNFYHFMNVHFYTGNDFIANNENTYWDKLKFSNFSTNNVQDANIVCVDRILQEITIVEAFSVINLEYAINCSGVHFPHWAHFLLERYESLIKLKTIIEKMNLPMPVVLVVSSMDMHIGEMMKKIFSDNSIFEFKEIESGVKVVCKNLFHLDRGAMIKDDGENSYLNDIIMRQSVKNCLIELNNPNEFISNPTRIFIGRTGNRNLINYKEVRDYFLGHGFIECFPNELDLEEKIDLFARASHIAGPGSSGFTNAIFSNKNVKIIGFLNQGRMVDTYLSGVIENPQNITVLLGDEIKSGDPHSNYYVSLDEIKNFIIKTNFLLN
jgi:hypothetical protein